MTHKRKKIFITGASGLLGSNLSLLAGDKGFEVYTIYNRNPVAIDGSVECFQLDVTDKETTCAALERIEPDCIIHTAALTNVDVCEGDQERAYRVNVEGTRALTIAANMVGARFIHISSDYVFDGTKGMYAEGDPVGPISYYGTTKVLQEKEVSSRLDDFCLVRTSLYGWNIQNKTSFAESVIHRAREREEIAAFTDQFFSPILVNNLSEALLELAGNDYRGVLHVGGCERVSRSEFIKHIAQVFDLSTDMIRHTTRDSLGLPARRPADSSLDISRAQEVLTSRLMTIPEGLKVMRELDETGYVKRLKAGLIL